MPDLDILRAHILQGKRSTKATVYWQTPFPEGPSNYSTDGCEPVTAGLPERVVDSSSIFVTVETAGATSALDHKLLGPLICIARPLFGGVAYYLITGCLDSHHALFMLFHTQYVLCR